MNRIAEIIRATRMREGLRQVPIGYVSALSTWEVVKTEIEKIIYMLTCIGRNCPNRPRSLNPSLFPSL